VSARARQAGCVAIGARAILIEGAAGLGKSSLALGLIDRGAMLVGDDSVMLEVAEGRLWAMPHPATHGLIEVRNLGLLPMPVAERVAVALVLRLDEAAPRFIEASECVDILGVALPCLALWPNMPHLPLRAELALAHYGLPI
jgi:serine kinase of HPr protein (carbohydrate metabolism regulator)